MDTLLLFRKRTPLTDDRLPCLCGSEEHPWAAFPATCDNSFSLWEDCLTHKPAYFSGLVIVIISGEGGIRTRGGV